MPEDPRKGQVLIIGAVVLVVLGIFAALTIDAGNVFQARARLQNSADAAVLAAAHKMMEERNIAATEQTSRQLATTEAQKFVNANWNAARFEIAFGRYDGGGVFVVQDSSTQAQAVRVKTVRDKTAPGGPLGAFFAHLVGIKVFDLSATSICKMSSGVWKIRYGLSPFAVFKDSLVPPGQTMKIYTDDQVVPGNVGLLNLDGGNLATPDLAEWIRNGYNGEITIDPVTHYVYFYGDCGIRSSLKDDVASRMGDVIVICVYDQVSAQGSNALFRIIKFTAVTLTGMRLTGNNKYIEARVERAVNVADCETATWLTDNLAKIQLAY